MAKAARPKTKIKQPWEMTWPEWVRYYEMPSHGYGNRFLFAKFVQGTFGISSVRGEPWPSIGGSNSRERWYNAIQRWARLNRKRIRGFGGKG